MKIAFGSDLKNEVTTAVEAWLRERGHDVDLFGALNAGDDDAWPHVGHAVASAVAGAAAQTGIVCCWTGTGVSMAANKVPGARAALCVDAQTAAGAREWNDANVLALSLRSTSVPIAQEILDAWFAATPTQNPKYRTMIATLELSP